MWRRTAALLFWGVWAGLVGAEPPDRFEARVFRVVDGDSVWVRREAAGPPLRLRLAGVDAPEICQPGGVAARDALVARLALAGQRVEVRLLGRDSYDRWLAQLQTTDGDVAHWLVSEGLAWNGGSYARQQAAARRARRGVFATPDPELPRDFRRRHGPCPFN